MDFAVLKSSLSSFLTSKKKSTVHMFINSSILAVASSSTEDRVLTICALLMEQIEENDYKITEERSRKTTIRCQAIFLDWRTQHLTAR